MVTETGGLTLRRRLSMVSLTTSVSPLLMSQAAAERARPKSGTRERENERMNIPARGSAMTGVTGPGALRPGSAPSSRYILPSFEERTAYGYKRQDPYAKLFEDRIIFLGVQVDDASADDIMAQLLVLESMDPDRD